MQRLEGKVAVITGGSGGIGAAAVRRFVTEGASVLAVDRDADALDALVAAVDQPRLATHVGDVTRPEVAEASTAAAVERFGGLDVVVLNAGVTGPNHLIEDYPIDAFDEVLSVNLRAAWLGLRAAIPHLKARGGGSVILTSSIQGLSAMPGTTGYTTSKHALVGMMKGAALELAAFGIRVNTVNPGFAATPMMDRIHAEITPDEPAIAAAMLSSTVPMRRYATPDEVASLMLFLAGDESTYSTGGTFIVDGGVLASWAPTPESPG